MFPYNDKLLPIMAKDTQKLFVAGLKNLFEESFTLQVSKFNISH